MVMLTQENKLEVYGRPFCLFRIPRSTHDETLPSPLPPARLNTWTYVS